LDVAEALDDVAQSEPHGHDDGGSDDAWSGVSA
jgi:hypothetical protein